MGLSARLLTLRRSPVLLKLPPYLSAVCIVVGVVWLLLLPLNDYSRQTYVSENAILPGQVHTYFGGSEHNIFRAFRQQVYDYRDGSEQERLDGIGRIMRESGLKVAEQDYTYQVAGEKISGTNVYGILQGPRADATEAMVIMAGWRNFEGMINYSGVALVLTLARYFSRWSIWSKDIIVIITPDSTYGPIAWVDAYHSTTPIVTATHNVSTLPIKAGALQAAVALDYPIGPWGHRYDKIDIQYDGLNGALPNLDLLNTAVSIASGQMHIGCTLHGITGHKDTYKDRLRTIAAGLATQSLGHATGPHSAFMPYHVDAITLKTMGDGWHDEMNLGRVTESLFRSINNLLEHLHQSFFFYVLLNANRFVSIGNYLPAAMLIAGSFTISALALWVQSGRTPLPDATPAQPSEEKTSKLPKMELVRDGEDVALVPMPALKPAERQLFLPALTLLGIHLASFVPLYFLTHLSETTLPIALHLLTAFILATPPALAYLLRIHQKATPQQLQTLQSISLLLHGATLSTLATLNFSLAFAVGLLTTPLAFVRATKSPLLAALASVVLAALSPMSATYAVAWWYQDQGLGAVLVELAKGWVAQGVWTEFVVWGVWWPAWLVAGTVVWSGVF
ncbi:hypothetical protein Q7P37_007394 [Cladosporium fusiforme]